MQQAINNYKNRKLPEKFPRYAQPRQHFKSPVTAYGNVIHFPSTIVRGQLSAVLKGRTYTQIVEIDQNNFGNSFDVYGTTTADTNKIVLNGDGYGNRFVVKNFIPIQEGAKYGVLVKTDGGKIDLYLNGLSNISDENYIRSSGATQYIKDVVSDADSGWGGDMWGSLSPAYSRYPCEIHDIRLIYLTSTETEDDFDNLTAEELFSKYTYVYGTKSTLSHVIQTKNAADELLTEAVVPVTLRSYSGTADSFKTDTGLHTQNVNDDADAVLADPVKTAYPGWELACEPSGTIYVLPQIKYQLAQYNGGITIDNTDIPIDSMEYCYKLDTETGEYTDVLADVTIDEDGLGFIIDGASDDEYYEYGYNYDTAISTIPVTDYDTPLGLTLPVTLGTTEDLFDPVVLGKVHRLGVE